jgi:1-deoxy-D-xylulose 5-phosphate reductoisomerase
MPKITEVTALTDYFTLDSTNTGLEIIPSEWLFNFVLKALDVLYHDWDENMGVEGVADMKFIRLLNELGMNIRRTPAVYALDDTSLNF